MGLRYFLVRRRWIVYYQPGEDVVWIVTIVPALVRLR